MTKRSITGALSGNLKPYDTQALRASLIPERGTDVLCTVHAGLSIVIDDDGLFALRITEASGGARTAVDVPFSEADLKRLKQQMHRLKRAKQAIGSLTLASAYSSRSP